MVIKEITYEDYNGEKRTESFYFNINETELIDLEMEYPGGLDKYADRVLKENDRAKTYKLFKTILFKSYGVKTDDGKHLIKDPEKSKMFECSPAYNELIMSFLDKPETMLDFIAGIYPKFTEEQKKQLASKKDEVMKELEDRHVGVN